MGKVKKEKDPEAKKAKKAKKAKDKLQKKELKKSKKHKNDEKQRDKTTRRKEEKASAMQSALSIFAPAAVKQEPRAGSDEETLISYVHKSRGADRRKVIEATLKSKPAGAPYKPVKATKSRPFTSSIAASVDMSDSDDDTLDDKIIPGGKMVITPVPVAGVNLQWLKSQKPLILTKRDLDMIRRISRETAENKGARVLDLIQEGTKLNIDEDAQFDRFRQTLSSSVHKVQGHWTVDEDVAIEAAISAYCEGRDWDIKTGVEAILEGTKSVGANGLFMLLAAVLPHRTPLALYSRAEVLFQPGSIEWTDEDDLKLRSLVDQHGRSWALIGKHMHRNREQCRTRFDELQGGRARSDAKWTSMRRAELSRQVRATRPEVAVNWTKIGAMIGMPGSRCETMWATIKPDAPVMESWGKKSKMRLVKTLEDMVKTDPGLTESSVPWSHIRIKHHTPSADVVQGVWQELAAQGGVIDPNRELGEVLPSVRARLEGH